MANDRPSPEELSTGDFEPTHLDGPDQVGPCRILFKSGEGGMGEVYKAEQERPVRRVVALKLIKTGMDSERFVTRFEAERTERDLQRLDNR